MAQLASDWSGTSDDIITSQSDEEEEDDDRSSDADYSPGTLIIDTGEGESDIRRPLLCLSLGEPPESIFFQQHSWGGKVGHYCHVWIWICHAHTHTHTHT